MDKSTRNSLLLLQLVVLIFGFTAILGKLISVSSEVLVWYRMGIAAVCLLIYSKLKGLPLHLGWKGSTQSIVTGFIVAAHWILFFEAIHQSSISITLAALSSASIFTSILEPIVFKRRFYWYEFVLGAIVILGLILIYQVEVQQSFGLFLGIGSAALAALFTVINGKLIQSYNSTSISSLELFGGFLAISFYGIFQDSFSFENIMLSGEDLIWIGILAIICTAFAFVASVEVMKDLSPFTVSLSVNLEPVYGIILAYFIFGEEEKMSFVFYIGAGLILCAIFLNVLVKKQLKKKAKRA